MNKAAKWIWGKEQKKDSYLAFKDSFKFDGKAELKVSAQTEFVAYVNGKRIAFGQFAGYENVNYVESVDISKFCRKRKSNELIIVVHYEGIDSFTHIDAGAGLIYEVEGKIGPLCYSDENTLYAIDENYLQGQKKLLTIQIGYSSSMQRCDLLQYKKSTVIERETELLQRPVKRLVLQKRVSARHLRDNVYVLGKEETGYLHIEISAEEACSVTVAYGEHIKNGKVERFLSGGYKNAGRDFSLTFDCKKGKNVFEQFFVRIAGRYFQIEKTGNATVDNLSVIPTRYPITVKNFDFVKGIDKRIYDTCVRTLRLCMQNHYEDCPWREQSLYVLDGRNQMLCGYKAFNGTNYQREMLVFISKSEKVKNLLELTYPARNTPSIPFFSLMYVVAVSEYLNETEDYSIMPEIKQTVYGILSEFASRIDANGLIPAFEAPFWNFYEWTKGSSHEEELEQNGKRVFRYDLILNAAFVYALNKYKNCDEDCKMYQAQADVVLNAIRKEFYDENKGLLHLSSNEKGIYSQLSNALGLLIGLGDERTLAAIKSDGLIPATLSMSGFVYDVLLQTNDSGNIDYIVEDIRKKYKYMLDNGATTFWETIDVLDDISQANSLCHGWSAMPIYYYNKIFNKRKTK